ncbi:MAG: hypothetical protein ACYCYR_01590 [Desulfobulbaceae bacterium]|jgi:hypothetical protein
MKKIILAGLICAGITFSGVTSHATESTGGKIITPDGSQPKQGWICKQAYSFYRQAWKSYSYLRTTDNTWLTLYDDGFERMAQGASDNYLYVCYYVLSTGGFNDMYTY